MSNFKVGDIVAPITNRWNGKFVVTKISGNKVTVQAWEDWGFFGRLFPLRTYTLPVSFVCVPEQDHSPGIPGIPCNAVEPKPPVSDPEEPKDRPL